MSRTNHHHTPQPPATALSPIPLNTKINIIEAAIEEKKEELVDLAAQGRFSFERAAQALDLIPTVVGKLAGQCRERFVTQVAMPLLTREPLPLLTICLASPHLQKLDHISDGLPTLLVEQPLRELSREIADGTIDRLAEAKILPIRSHAIAYRPANDARPLRALLVETMHTVAEILDSTPFVQQHRFACLDSTTCVHLQRRDSPLQHISESTFVRHLSLLVDPSTRAIDLAAALVREDQRARFELTHGLCQSREVVPDSYRQRVLRGATPLVATTPTYPSLLLKEFSASAAALAFLQGAVVSGVAPQSSVAGIRSSIRRGLLEARQAESVLNECVQRRDFNRHGIALFAKCQELFRSTVSTTHTT